MKYVLNRETLRIPRDELENVALLKFTNRMQEALEDDFAHGLPMSDAAKRQILFILFKQLGRMSRDTFRQIKQEYMAEKNPLAALDSALATAEQRERASSRLLAELEQTDCALLFERVPLLEGWFELRTERFSAFIRQMLKRLTVDAPLICRTFFPGRELGTITGVTADGADLHFHGCCTCVIETEGGKFVYKPHDCMADAVTGGIVEAWFSDVLMVPRCLPRQGYGYTQFIESHPLADEAAAKRYYYRLGGAFALFQALGSTDLHAENWRACGEHPALVDLETILAPTVRVYADASQFAAEEPEPDDFLYDANRSLISSGMLPQGSGREQLSIFMASEHENTGCPVLDGRTLTVAGYEAEALEGFTQIYDRCMALSGELSAALEAFRDVPLRYLLRNTNYYARLQERLYSVKALQNRENQERVCASTSRFFLSVGARQMLPIAEWERACLLEGDIPYFSAMSGGRDLLGYGNVVIPGFFRKSGIENALERISRLTPEEKGLEYQLMRQAFSTALCLLPGGSAERPFPASGPITPELARSEALEILRRLESDAVTGPSGKTCWFLRRSDGKALGMGQPTLFQGTMGLGVFFAAAAAVFPDRAVRTRARVMAGACAAQVAGYIRQTGRLREFGEKSFHTGMSDGLGGVIQALRLMDRYLPDMGCGKLCAEAAALLDKYRLEEAMQTDVFSGLSGLILALAPLPGAEGAIRRAADRLLELRMPSDGKYPGLWDTLSLGRPISGAGHGHAGIAAALLAAAEALGDGKYIAPALCALEFEHGIYSDSLGTWPDLRESAIPMRAMHGLCSGAPGIGLALLRCRDSAMRLNLEIPGQQEDLERAVRACLNGRKSIYRDHLCCGNSAVTDFLLEASTAGLADSDRCAEAAHALLGKMAGRKAHFGSYTLLPGEYVQTDVINLFYGTAGIGYEFLRSIDPEAIRPVLFS